MCTDAEGLETRLRCSGMANQALELNLWRFSGIFHLTTGMRGNRFASSYGMEFELYSEIL